MSKILVIFTGGTIGSGINMKGNIDIDPVAKSELTDRYFKEYGKVVDFDTAEPYYALSENIDAEHWNRLIGFIDKVDYKKYSGIILTHGSDTLPYTAAALSFALRHIPVPLILVAANYPLSDKRSNGLQNFAAAVSLIEKSPFERGIFVCYGNKPQETDVYIGSRLLEADHIFDEFCSVDKTRLGKIVDGKFLTENNPLNPASEEINKEKTPLVLRELKNNILMLRSYPGLKFENISLKGIRAVLAVGYHSATVCASGKSELSFWEFAKRCQNEGVDVFISSFKSEEGSVYASLEGDFYRLCNISPEAAYAKLVVAFATDCPKSVIDSNIYFETV